MALSGGSMNHKGLITLAAMMLCGCQSDSSGPTERLRQALVAGQPAAILKLVHSDYSDALGTRAELLKDLEWWQHLFEKRAIKFENLSSGRSSGGLASMSGVLQLRLDGDTQWYFQGPLTLEFVAGLTPQVRTGILGNFRDIHRLLDRRKEAVEANNGKAYQALLHPNYRLRDENHKEAAERIAKFLEGSALRIDANRYDVDVRASIAHVNEWRTPLSTTSTNTNKRTENRVKRGASIKGQLTLRKSAGRWRIMAIYGQF